MLSDECELVCTRPAPLPVLSDECELVSEWPVTVALCRTKAAPLVKSSGAVDLEVIALGDVSVLIEMVVNGSVDSNEFLQVSHAPEADHCPFSSSKWLM